MNFIENINNINELDQIIKTAQNRKELLSDQERAKDWEGLRIALYNYIGKWGKINVENRYYEVIISLDSDFDVDGPGAILVD
jgi:hypothetical protein